MQKTKLAIIIPFFEDLATQKLFDDLAKEISSDAIVIVVDDGSSQDVVQTQWLEQAGLEGRIVRLKQNMGHQPAIAVGLNYVVNELDADRVVVMDADGEDRPASMNDLLNELTDDSAQIVVAQRRSRVETIRFKLFYAIYRMVFWLFVGRSISFGNYMAMNKPAAERLAGIASVWQHVAATALNSRINIVTAPVDRGRRYSGQSKMNFISLTLHGLKAIMVFSERVLVRISLCCGLLAALLLFGLFVMLILKFSGYAILGWFSTISGLIIMMLFQIGITTLMVLMIAGNSRLPGESQIDYQLFVKVVERSGG